MKGELEVPPGILLRVPRIPAMSPPPANHAEAHDTHDIIALQTSEFCFKRCLIKRASCMDKDSFFVSDLRDTPVTPQTMGDRETV